MKSGGCPHREPGVKSDIKGIKDVQVSGKKFIGLTIVTTEQGKILFLAGIFDGEGSFGVWGKGNGRKSFQCSVEMCDKDIIDERFADKFGGSILPVKVRKDNWKQTWKWKMSGKRAFAIVGKMVEYMCQRRKDKYNVVKCNQISG